MPLGLIWQKAENDGPHFPGFLRLEKGRTELRVFRKPFMFGVHWITTQEGKLSRVLCEPGNCYCCGNEELPAKERVAQKRFSMWVTQSQGQTLKVWEVGIGLFKDIRKIIHEDLRTENYDLEVWREGEGIETRYKVIRMPNFKYSESTYNKINEKIDMYDMKGLVGDKGSRAEMLLRFEEEQRILDKAW